MALAAVVALGLSEAPVYEPVDGRLQATLSGADLVLGEVAIELQQQDALVPLVMCEVQPPTHWLTARVRVKLPSGSFVGDPAAEFVGFESRHACGVRP